MEKADHSVGDRLALVSHRAGYNDSLGSAARATAVEDGRRNRGCQPGRTETRSQPIAPFRFHCASSGYYDSNWKDR